MANSIIADNSKNGKFDSREKKRHQPEEEHGLAWKITSCVCGRHYEQKAVSRLCIERGKGETRHREIRIMAPTRTE